MSLAWGGAAAIGFAAGSVAAASSAVATLTKGVSNTMFLTTHKCVAVLAGGVLVLAGLHLAPEGCPGARVLALAGFSAGPGGAVACPSAAQAAPVSVAPPAESAEKEDKDKSALSGVWVRKEGEPKIEFADKGVVKIAPHGNDEVLLILCRCTAEKGGRVKLKITGLDGKDEAKEAAKEKLPVGTEFSFTWKVKADTATLEDVKGDKVEPFKAHLEGEYGKKK
jgi:hypothetical protein